MKNLRQILAEEGLLSKKAYPSLDSQMTKAVQVGNVVAMAELLDKKFGDDAYLSLDEMRREIVPLLQAAPGFKGDYSFIKDVDTLLMRKRVSRTEHEVNSSPWKKELKILTGVFTSTVAPKDVSYINFQPIVRKGVITKVILEDHDSHLGHMRTSLTPSEIQQGGSTLPQMLTALEAMGANLVKKGLGPGKRKPWTDYDGWAH